MPVHLYGEPADMDAIMTLARKHGSGWSRTWAGAGAKVRGRRTGALGHAGAQLLPDQHLAPSAMAARHHRRCPIGRAAAQLRNYGSRVKYVNLSAASIRGSTRCRPPPARQAAPARRLNEHRRRRLPATTTSFGIRASACRAPQWAEPVWHLYVVRPGAGPT
jgi:hypothetical protein